MLYCPKCQRTYDEGAQRFCTADNARLLPAPDSSLADAANRGGGVFTGIFNRAASLPASSGEKISPASSFAEKDASQSFRSGFRPPPTSKIFKPEEKVEQEAKKTARTRAQIEKSAPSPFEVPLGIPFEKPSAKTFEKPFEEASAPTVQKAAPLPEKDAAASSSSSSSPQPEEIAPPKPLPRFVKPFEIPASQATLGDRKTNLSGRLALSWEKPEVLIGQTIKGRYRITEKTGADASGLAYLAHDKIGERQVAVRILMDEDANDYFADKRFAEERITLSHTSHPNVASVVDSGVLPEGKPFIVTEYVAGKTIREMLAASGQFNALRAARIIRQAAYALSEVHQSGILHRGLTPENIVLTVSEKGVEQVKLTDFGVARDDGGGGGGKTVGNLAYAAPEQIGGKSAATKACDIYSLAVIAFEMLTDRLPFDASTPGGLVRVQRAGLNVGASDLRLGAASAVVDEILEKALAFNPSERYPKTRDFGDAFYNAVTTAALWEGGGDAAEKDAAKISEAGKVEIIADEKELTQKTSEQNETAEMFAADADLRDGEISAAATSGVSAPLAVEVGKIADTVSALEQAKSSDDNLWERRSPEPPPTAKNNWAMTVLFGTIVALSAIGLWYFLQNRAVEPELGQNPTPIMSSSGAPGEQPQSVEALTRQNTQPSVEIESAPPPRTIAPPPNFVYFENSKQNLKGEALKNFIGFLLYYPKDWKQNDAKNNFLDISKNAPTGTPVEQMLVSFYNSRGTFGSDREMFPALVQETNRTLAKIVPNFKAVSNGETTINDGWRAYEVKFEGAGKTAQGENIKLWGRRLFVPAERNGLKNGYVLTMLATSLSPDVKSAEDVGVKGDLSTILNTFEPNQNF